MDKVFKERVDHYIKTRGNKVPADPNVMIITLLKGINDKLEAMSKKGFEPVKKTQKSKEGK